MTIRRLIFSLTLLVLVNCKNGWSYVPLTNPNISLNVVKTVYPSDKWKYKLTDSVGNCHIYSSNNYRSILMKKDVNYNFSLLSRNGRSIQNIDIDGGFNERITNLRLTNQYFVCADTGAVIGVWKAGGSADRSTYKYLMDSVLYFVYSSLDGKQLYSGSVIKNGMPIAITGKTLWTIRITNPINYFMNGYNPHLAFDIRRVRDSSLIAEIPIPYSMALKYDSQVNSGKSNLIDIRYTDFWQLFPYCSSQSKKLTTIIFGNSISETAPKYSVPENSSRGLKIVWRHES